MKIKVLGGAIDEGKWNIIPGNGALTKGGINKQALALKGNVKSITVLNQENIKSFVGSAGWGFVGSIATGALLGGVGAIAGLGAGIASGGNKQKLVVAVELVDDSRFVAEISSKLLKTFQGYLKSEQKSSLVQKSNFFVETAQRQRKQEEALGELFGHPGKKFNKLNPLERMLVILFCGGLVMWYLLSALDT